MVIYTLQQELLVKKWQDNPRLRYLTAVPVEQLADTITVLRRRFGLTDDGT
jgi:hypothetical protein